MNVIMDTPQSTEILTLLNRIDAKLGGGLAEFRLEVATRFEAVDVRFDGIDKRLDAMDARFDGVDRKIEALDRRLDRKIDGLRTDLVDHMGRIHKELDLRLRDVEPRQPKARAKYQQT